MRRTVADLIKPKMAVEEYDPSMDIGTERLESNTERVFTVSLVVDLTEAELLNNKVVIEKRVLARNRREALDKCGFTVKQ